MGTPTTDLQVRNAYVAWYLRPQHERISRKLWVEEYGVNESTAIRWEKQPWFQEAVDKMRAELELSPDKVLEVVEALQRKAATGDPRAIDIFLKYQERINGPSLSDESSDWTDEQLAQMLRDELEVVEERIAASGA